MRLPGRWNGRRRWQKQTQCAVALCSMSRAARCCACLQKWKLTTFHNRTTLVELKKEGERVAIAETKAKAAAALLSFGAHLRRPSNDNERCHNATKLRVFIVSATKNKLQMMINCLCFFLKLQAAASQGTNIKTYGTLVDNLHPLLIFSVLAVEPLLNYYVTSFCHFRIVSSIYLLLAHTFKREMTFR